MWLADEVLSITRTVAAYGAVGHPSHPVTLSGTFHWLYSKCMASTSAAEGANGSSSTAPMARRDVSRSSHPHAASAKTAVVMTGRGCMRPNENKISHRWRERAVLGMNVS